MSKIAVLFAGQGAQYFQMGQDFYEQYPAYKELVGEAFKVNDNLETVLYQEDEGQLNETINAQLAIASMELGIYNIVREQVAVEGVAGFSLGEYSALQAAGLIDINDLFNLLQVRATLMSEANIAGTMCACLKTDYATVENAVEKLKEDGIELEIANYNTEDQIVLSGLKEDFEKAGDKLKEYGIKRVVPLSVSGPFHSSHYQPVADQFLEYLIENDYFEVNNLTKDIYLNLTAEKLDKENLNDYLAQHLTEGVKWVPLIKEMIADGYDTFIEIGPKNTLTNFMKKINKNVKIINIEKVADLEKLKELE